MSIEHFLDNSISSWMAGDGKHSDIVMSTRIRLARNLNGYRFPLAFTEDEAHKIDQSVSATLLDASDELRYAIFFHSYKRCIRTKSPSVSRKTFNQSKAC